MSKKSLLYLLYGLHLFVLQEISNYLRNAKLEKQTLLNSLKERFLP